MSTVTELGWLAGIADGEGSFYISLTHDRNGSLVYKCSFAVGNTNELIIKELKRLYTEMTGKERRYCPIKGRGNRKRSWLIQLTSFGDLKLLCEAILPYLIGKKAQAETMLEFIALGTGHAGSNRDTELFEARRVLMTRMKHLNRYRTGSSENAAEDLLTARDLKAGPDTGDVKVRSASRDAEPSRNDSALQIACK